MHYNHDNHDREGNERKRIGGKDGIVFCIKIPMKKVYSSLVYIIMDHMKPQMIFEFNDQLKTTFSIIKRKR